MKRHEILRTLMIQRDMNIADVVKKTGIPYSTVKSIFENGVEKSAYSTVCAICYALSITTDQLEQMAAALSSTPEGVTKFLFDIADFSAEEMAQLKQYAEFIRYMRKFD